MFDLFTPWPFQAFGTRNALDVANARLFRLTLTRLKAWSLSEISSLHNVHRYILVSIIFDTGPD